MKRKVSAVVCTLLLSVESEALFGSIDVVLMQALKLNRVGILGLYGAVFPKWYTVDELYT